jgi:predicted DCC family thiol-disulfide oxidoreductase YuxK
VNTEITETIKGWVFYDADCSACRSSAKYFEQPLRRRGVRLAPLQADWVQKRLGLTMEEALYEMKFLTTEGEMLGGADAFIAVARFVWWGWPIYFSGRLPIARRVMRRGYRWLANRRHCTTGGCRP